MLQKDPTSCHFGGSPKRSGRKTLNTHVYILYINYNPYNFLNGFWQILRMTREAAQKRERNPKSSSAFTVIMLVITLLLCGIWVFSFHRLLGCLTSNGGHDCFFKGPTTGRILLLLLLGYNQWTTVITDQVSWSLSVGQPDIQSCQRAYLFIYLFKAYSTAQGRLSGSSSNTKVTVSH